MAKLFAGFLALLTPMVCSATPLVISDIDDTLKVTQVRDTLRLSLSALETGRHFVGMPSLMKGLAEKGAKFAYISAAPKNLATTLHQGFLDEHKFPKGELLLRESGADKIAFKVKAISEQIRRHKPTSLVLFGDNGEFDPAIFAQVKQLFPKLKIQSFIHTVYRRGLMPISYSERNLPHATAVEAAFRLESMGMIDRATRMKIETEVEAGIGKDEKNEFIRPQVFPVWIDCGTEINRYLSRLPKKWQESVARGCSRGRLNSAAADIPKDCD